MTSERARGSAYRAAEKKPHMPLPCSAIYVGRKCPYVGRSYAVRRADAEATCSEGSVLRLAHDASLRVTFEGVLCDEHPTIIKMSDS